MLVRNPLSPSLNYYGGGSRSDWSPKRVFWIALALTLAFRVWLAAAFPITGDEAYFIWWGKVPDWGFYDHPPMIGWWLAVLLKVSSAEWWLRLPIVLQPAILALATASFLRRHGETKAWGAACLVLLAPANIWNVFITTDTPLIYFSVFSGLAWLRARRVEQEHRPSFSPWGWYVIAGLCLGGAVLSKYFAALLGFAYLIDTIVRPSRRKIGGLLLVYALTLPGIALMAWWNTGHCWSNVMFNFYNRHQEGNAGWSLKTPLLYGGMMLYLLTPALFWHLPKQFYTARSVARTAEGRALMIVGLVPLFLFAGLSLVKSIGLHWVLSFVPFVLIWLVLSLGESRIKACIKFFAVFGALHVLTIVAVAIVPLEKWRDIKIYDGVVLTFESEEVLAHLEPYADHVWMMDGYSNAVTLGFDTIAQSKLGERYIGVFGPASSHARHDDILTDFSVLNGRDFAILRKTEPQADEYSPWFASVVQKTFEVRGATFHLIIGKRFNYAAYRDGILAKIKQDYYRIPEALPQTACYFCDRYFPGQPCQR